MEEDDADEHAFHRPAIDSIRLKSGRFTLNACSMFWLPGELYIGIRADQ